MTENAMKQDRPNSQPAALTKEQIEDLRDYLMDIECPFDESIVDALCDLALKGLSGGPAEAVKAGEEMLARYILKNMDVPEGGDDANVRFLTEILLEHRRQCEARQSAGAER